MLNSANVATPDGMPVVWALRSFGEAQQQRVYGPDLMLALCAAAEQYGYRIYFYGGHGEILSNLRQRLLKRFPNLLIAGEHSPPFRPLTPEEDDRCVAAIIASEADIVFVGLSTPKQDYWMMQHRDRLPGVILVGVGAAFELHAVPRPSSSGTATALGAWSGRSVSSWNLRDCGNATCLSPLCSCRCGRSRRLDC